ncbi:nuclear transport factor 2 family protein [Agrobacterium sp. a22-2]|uniref:nuclear transport factor 2 family protein n=1 Tax=Agrobacterium sp. a22-2 TaxID=2283840 RepID=UPI0014461059|nr:nuclear transport factor 2 family protein [Agrobacterium sp. a22-2]NKN39793.1 nuclear transport factor 2 family protein [Agrobacterium sp. a22-2]
MPFDPVAAVHRFHAAINGLDFATIEAFFAEDAVYGSIKVGALEGRPAILQAFRSYFDTYPDQVALDESVEAVSPMAARAVWSLNATHSKTGEALVRHGEETITFDDAGRIIRVDVTDY